MGGRTDAAGASAGARTSDGDPGITPLSAPAAGGGGGGGAEGAALGADSRARRRRKLVIDTDSGADDAVGLMAMFSRADVDVVAITTCWGNVGVDQSVENVAKLLDFYGLDIPLYRGAAGPLVGDRETVAWGGWGADGYGDADFPRPLHKATAPEPACLALSRLLAGVRPAEESGEVWQVVVLGPCTNLALALKLDGGCCDRLGGPDPAGGGDLPGVVLMGGAIEAKGNSSMAAEFNFHCDPEAAHIVLHTAHPRGLVSLVPWELCVSCPMTWRWFDRWLGRGAATPQSRCQLFLERLFTKLEAFTRTDGSGKVADTGDDPSTQDETAVIPDAVAVAAALDPAFVTESFETYCTVELWGRETRGMSVLDWYGTDASMKARGRVRNCSVAMKCDSSVFLRLMDEIVLCPLVSGPPATPVEREGKGQEHLFEPGRRRSVVCQQALAAASQQKEPGAEASAPACIAPAPPDATAAPPRPRPAGLLT